MTIYFILETGASKYLFFFFVRAGLLKQFFKNFCFFSLYTLLQISART